MSTGGFWVIILLVLAGVMTMAAGLIYVERKLLALWQDRHGPNRVGPAGLFQVVADMVKILSKEDWIPPFADKATFVLAPTILIFTVIAGLAVIVFAPGWTVTDLNIGVLYFLAFSSLGVYSVVLAGWASNSKFSLLGGLRASAQMMSHEVFLGLSMMGVVMLAGSFNIGQIIEAQKGLWYVVPQLPGFVIFIIAGLAETRRLPFDLPEAENELVAGYHSEYSGMKFAMFFLGEYIGVTLISSMAVVLFLGGYWGPWVDQAPAWGLLWYLLKTMLLISLFVLVRGSLPRLRYDQLMGLSWKVLLPLALANLLVTAAVVLMKQ